MKRSAEPFELLVNDELLIPFINKWRKEDDFPVDELPLELVVKIVYDHLDTLLAIFALNSRLNAIANMKGFWSGLFAIAFPAQALNLIAFMREAPELALLDMQRVTDVLILTAVFETEAIAKRARQRHELSHIDGTPQLVDVEQAILEKGSIDLLAPYYILNTLRDGTVSRRGRYSFIPSEKRLKFTARAYLIKFYLIMQSALIMETDSLAESIFKVALLLANENKREQATDLYVILRFDSTVTRLFDYWIKQLELAKLPRIKEKACQLITLREAYVNELVTIALPNPATGKLHTFASYYLPQLETLFQSYFGLSDEETTLHMKKLFVQTRRGYKGNPLSDTDTLTLRQCSFCAVRDNVPLFKDSKFGIAFCGEGCQESFRAHFVCA